MNSELNPEPELGQWLPPLGVAPPELRAAVLDRVTAELSRQRERRLTRHWVLGAACLLLAGVLANVGVLQYEERRFQDLCGPAPVSRSTNELFQAVAEVTDEETATQWQERWLAVRAKRTRDPDKLALLYAAQLRRSTDVLNWE